MPKAGCSDSSRGQIAILQVDEIQGELHVSSGTFDDQSAIGHPARPSRVLPTMT